MRIPQHLFSPDNLEMPYAQEINRYMEKPGLWIREYDLEMSDATEQRFLAYIEKQPDRIHVSPYLIRTDTEKGELLVWINRNFQTRTAATLPKTVRQKVVNYLPGKPDPLQIIISVTIPVQGGEPEAFHFGLGSTYIPESLWHRIFPRVAETDWSMLDVRISEQAILEGQKALLHWDCLSNHYHVLEAKEKPWLAARRKIEEQYPSKQRLPHSNRIV